MRLALEALEVLAIMVLIAVGIPVSIAIGQVLVGLILAARRHHRDGASDA